MFNSIKISEFLKINIFKKVDDRQTIINDYLICYNRN